MSRDATVAANVATTMADPFILDSPRRTNKPPAFNRHVSLPNVTLPNITRASPPANTRAIADVFAIAQDDDHTARYLLTFAHAGVAQEWYRLLQLHFQGISRPGAQLFAFRSSDVLAEAWKHSAFQHLKSQWMYVAFGKPSASAEGLGVAGGQTVIPVQDTKGNILSSGSPDVGAPRRPSLESRIESRVQKLEDLFERMVMVVEKSAAASSSAGVNPQQPSEASKEGQSSGDVDKTVRFSQAHGEGMAENLDRINDLLAKNAEYVADLTRRHSENEERLRTVTKTLDARPPASPSSALDLSSLTNCLEKVQEAVERNSALLESRVEGNSEVESSASGNQSGLPNLQSMTQSLQGLSTQSDKTNELLQELIGAVHENGGEIDFTPVAELLDSVRDATDRNSSHLESFLATAVEQQSKIDSKVSSPSSLQSSFEPTTFNEDGSSGTSSTISRRPSQQQSTQVTNPSGPNFVLSALSSHLSHLQALTEQNAQQIQSLQQALAILTSSLHQSRKDARTNASPNKQGRMLNEEDQLHGQVRELVDVLRDLTRGLKGEQPKDPGNCGHVVLPPPRKTERKVVGFVYEGSNGGSKRR